MNGKVITVAVSLAILVGALVAMYSAGYFGADAKGFHMVVSRGKTTASLSYLNGAIKATIATASGVTEEGTPFGRFIQVDGDMVYSYAVGSTDNKSPYTLASCYSLKETSTGINSVSDVSIAQTDTGDINVLVADAPEPLFVVKMSGTTPTSIFQSSNEYSVTSFSTSGTEVVFPAAFPANTAVCTGEDLIPITSNRRVLPDVYGSTPTQQSKLLKAMASGYPNNFNQYTVDGWTHTSHIVSGSNEGTLMVKTVNGALWCGVAFAGSNDGNDVIADISTWYVDCGIAETKCHSGFYNAYKSLEPQFKSFVASRGCSKFHFMGHSMGGAMAQVGAALFSATYGSSNVRVSTFGGARVFTNRNLNIGDSLRIVNEWDMVPNLPPNAFGFYHPQGAVQVCDRDQSLCCGWFCSGTCPYVYSCFSASNDWSNWSANLNPYQGVQYHLTGRYFEIAKNSNGLTKWAGQ